MSELKMNRGICQRCGTLILPPLGARRESVLCYKCESEVLNDRKREEMYTTTTDMSLTIGTTNRNGYRYSDKIEYKPLLPNGGMLIKAGETVSFSQSTPQNTSTTEKKENKMTRKHALITFKNGNNMLCPVSENGNILRYDLAELVTKGISGSKFREEMRKTDYSLKRGMWHKPVVCPICKGTITVTVDNTYYQDAVLYYKCQKCGRRISDIERDLANFLDGDLATLSSVVEIDNDGSTLLKYSEKQKTKDEQLDCSSIARILEKALKEMEATDQMAGNRIVEIKEIVPNKIYEYRFEDGDIQKTICSDSDHFSMEDSITIAYAKHFMGGSGVYNRAVEKTMKLFSNQKAAEEKAKKEAEATKTRREKKAKKRAERAARKREAEIELQAEAYRRAMQSMASEKPKEE